MLISFDILHPLTCSFYWQGIEGSLKNRKLVGIMLDEKHTKVDEQGPRLDLRTVIPQGMKNFGLQVKRDVGLKLIS